ncbi:MAG: histidine kinase [Acidobacteriota bacterium]
MSPARSQGRSPTPGLLVGLVLTLAAVAAYSYSTTRQISGLRVLQTDLVDRNRRDSLQLLRVQNNLNLLGLAMRDMLDQTEPYPLTAWSAQFTRIRRDLDDALKREAEAGAAPQAGRERDGLADSMGQFWDAVDRTFALAASGQETEARAQIRLSLQARQSALSTLVSRLLVANNERGDETAVEVQRIYDRVQRQGYWLLTATLIVIGGTGLYVIRSNRRLFAELASLSDGRRELAQQLIATRESTLRHVSRELHDELGQILTAMGVMLGRAERRIAETDPLRAELREIGEMAQQTLNNVRSLSQTLHPSILDELGLDSTFQWYVATAEKQLGVRVHYERIGTPVPVDGTVAIHVYRVMQEALSNVARHARTTEAWVRLAYRPDRIDLEVEDHGAGIDARIARRGLGLVAMRERAELVGGTILFLRPEAGGTLVRLSVPWEEPEPHGA